MAPELLREAGFETKDRNTALFIVRAAEDIEPGLENRTATTQNSRTWRCSCTDLIFSASTQFTGYISFY